MPLRWKIAVRSSARGKAFSCLVLQTGLTDRMYTLSIRTHDWSDVTLTRTTLKAAVQLTSGRVS